METCLSNHLVSEGLESVRRAKDHSACSEEGHFVPELLCWRRREVEDAWRGISVTLTGEMTTTEGSSEKGLSSSLAWRSRVAAIVAGRSCERRANVNSLIMVLLFMQRW